MRKWVFVLIAAIAILGTAATASAQGIPKELWGTWTVRKQLPTTTISCWSEKDAKAVIGTRIEYSGSAFRWKKVLIKNPTADTITVSAQKFHEEHSGGGSQSSQVDFRQLGITSGQITQVTIQHPEANLTGATSEIPGDVVLLKGPDTIVFSACNVYFEAERTSGPAKP